MMNRQGNIIGLLAFLMIPFVPPYLMGQELTGAGIVEQVNQIMNPQSSTAKVEMVVHGKNDQTRHFVYDSWSLDKGEKNLVRYTEPRRLMGQATLMRNFADDIWMYFVRTKRVRKLASHAKKQKMEGSDFSYEDMGSGNSFLTDYDASRLDDEELEGQTCYVVDLNRKTDSDAGYAKIRMWVLQSNYVPIRMDYYEEEHPDVVSKRLIQSDIRVIDEIPTAMNLLMENLKDNTSTEMKLLNVEYNTELDEAMFTERGLRK